MASCDHLLAQPMAPDAKRQLYLAGTGTFATQVAAWATDAGWEVAGLVEMCDRSRVGRVVSGHRVLAPDSLPEGSQVVIAAGGDRSAHHAVLRDVDCHSVTVVHPTSHLSSSERLAAGCIVGPSAVIDAETVIGEHTLISRGTLIGHHVRAGNFVSLLPGVNVGGNVEVGDRTSVGMGAVLVNAIRVGTDATIAAGAVVVRPVADGARVQGVPAREYRP